MEASTFYKHGLVLCTHSAKYLSGHWQGWATKTWCISSKPRHRNSQLGEETMLTSRPLQSPHCAMALKHVNQKAARCYWCQIVVTPLVPKQNAAGGPKVVTLTPLRSSAHRNAANGWCGSSLLLCLTHCIEVHDFMGKFFDRSLRSQNLSELNLWFHQFTF